MKKLKKIKKTALAGLELTTFYVADSYAIHYTLLWYSEKVNDRQYMFMICGFFEAFLYVEQ